MKLRALALSLSLVVANGAAAGLLDSPPPVFADGLPGLVVYRMGPIYFDPGHIDTVIRCTNIGESTMPVTLEVFDASDRLAGSATSASVAPGADVAFGTTADPSRPGIVVIDTLGSVSHGKARVSATGKSLACVGIQVLRKEDGTTREMSLELVKKVAF